MSSETDLTNLKQEEKNHQIRLLIFENKQTGKVLYACYMSIGHVPSQNAEAVHYKHVGLFTGSIVFYTLDGVLANGWQYVDGKVEKIIKGTTKLQYDVMMQRNAVGAKGKLMDNGRPPYCLTRIAPRYRLGCVGVSGYEKCSYLFDGWDYSDICSYFDNDDGLTPTGGGSGGTGGDYYPPIKDCAGVDNGTAYFDNKCGCIGGTTGIVACVQKDIIDSLRGYPCAQALLRELPDLNTDLAALIKKTFGTNANIDLRFSVDNTLKNTATDGKFDGLAGTSPNNGAIYKILLNPDVLSKSTKEYILATMYHEALHAYIAYAQSTLSADVFAATFGSLDFNGGRTLFREVNGHFELAANNYMNGIRDAILAFNPNYDKGRAYSLAQGGIVQLSAGTKAINDQERDTTKPGYIGTKCP